MNNKPNLLATTLAFALTALASAPLAAEQIVVPVGTQGKQNQIEVPNNGVTQASVRERWGEPTDIRGPVGQPPITQWHYAGFIVYFEGNRVLHTVIRPSR
ncbi:hypothetical protein [Marinobacter oulmenensis]|uniref:Phosphodiesterase n=1 Tax=Marinobacter oulmenensis TaxID=643747 RepID=A0A840UMZ6_9GAMM|nr:hypothetical protein [Marinobacter oulmenensis]MBB5322456.1 hypothetical protein [Marinobacter oulmenensis]